MAIKSTSTALNVLAWLLIALSTLLIVNTGYKLVRFAGSTSFMSSVLQQAEAKVGPLPAAAYVLGDQNTLLLLFAGTGLLAGIGLLRRYGWARPLAMLHFGCASFGHLLLVGFFAWAWLLIRDCYLQAQLATDALGYLLYAIATFALLINLAFAALYGALIYWLNRPNTQQEFCLYVDKSDL